MYENKIIYSKRPESLTNPVAEKVQWKPSDHGKVSFKNTTLYWSRVPGVLKLGPSMRTITSGILFVIIGATAGVFLYFIYNLTGIKSLFFFGAIFSIIPILTGIDTLKKSSTLYIFDFNQNIIITCNKDGNQHRSLKDFEAVQIILGINIQQSRSSTERSNPRSGYTSGVGISSSRGIRSYQINLVDKEGERILIEVNDNKKHLKKNAQMLADNIKIPLWDGIN